MNDTYTIALIRGIVLSILAAGAAFFTTMQATDASVESAAIVAGATFFTTLLTRVGGEGTVDSQNDTQRLADQTKRHPLT